MTGNKMVTGLAESIYLKETSARESEYQLPQNLKVKLEINLQSLILTKKSKIYLHSTIL